MSLKIFHHILYKLLSNPFPFLMLFFIIIIHFMYGISIISLYSLLVGLVLQPWWLYGIPPPDTLMRTRQLICRNPNYFGDKGQNHWKLDNLTNVKFYDNNSFFSLWRCRDFSCQFTSAFSLIAGIPFVELPTKLLFSVLFLYLVQLLLTFTFVLSL